VLDLSQERGEWLGGVRPGGNAQGQYEKSEERQERADHC
jgi:hypothetical protein